jgi:hypothetical protein
MANSHALLKNPKTLKSLCDAHKFLSGLGKALFSKCVGKSKKPAACATGKVLLSDS